MLLSLLNAAIFFSRFVLYSICFCLGGFLLLRIGGTKTDTLFEV